MAGIVNEEWTWDVNVKESSANEQNVKIVAWNSDSATAVVNQTTNASGNITQQELQEAVHSITGTSTLSTDDKTPHVVAALKYKLIPLEFSISFNSARTDTFFMAEDTNIKTGSIGSPGAVASYSIDIDHGTDEIEVNANYDIRDVYDRTQWSAWNSPQKDNPRGVMLTSDGNNYTVVYDIDIATGVTLDCLGKSLNMGSKVINVLGTGILDDAVVLGDVNWNSGTTLTDLEITGTLDFGVAGTYSLSNCTVNEVTNSSGGAVTLNASNTTITTNTGPNITINNAVTYTVKCVDTSGSAIEDARIHIVAASGGPLAQGAVIYDGTTEADTDVNGEISDTLNYTADQPITGVARRATAGLGDGKLYKSAPIVGTITSSGFNTTITMILDE